MKVWAYRTYVSCLFGTLSSFFLFICLVFCKLNACLFWNKCLKVSVGIKIHISSNGWTTRMVLSQSRQNPDSVPEVIPRDCSFCVSVTLPVLALMVGKWHSGQWQFSWESASTKRCLGLQRLWLCPHYRLTSTPWLGVYVLIWYSGFQPPCQVGAQCIFSLRQPCNINMEPDKRNEIKAMTKQNTKRL